MENYKDFFEGVAPLCEIIVSKDKTVKKETELNLSHCFNHCLWVILRPECRVIEVEMLFPLLSFSLSLHCTGLIGKINQVCKQSTPETRKIQIHQLGGWEWKQREHYFQKQKAHPGLFVLSLSLVDVNNLNSGLMFKCSIWFLLLYLVFVLVLSFWYINLVAASRQSLRFQALCLLGHCLSAKKSGLTKVSLQFYHLLPHEHQSYAPPHQSPRKK